MKNSLRFFLWLAALLGASVVAVAQHSPECQHAIDVYNTRVAAYERAVASHNVRCSNVVAGSAAAAQCAAETQQLNDEAADIQASRPSC